MLSIPHAACIPQSCQPKPAPTGLSCSASNISPLNNNKSEVQQRLAYWAKATEHRGRKETGTGTVLYSQHLYTGHQHSWDVTYYTMTRTCTSPGSAGVKVTASSTSLVMLFLIPVALEYLEYDPERWFSTRATKMTSGLWKTLLTLDCGYRKLILRSPNHFGVDNGWSTE